ARLVAQIRAEFGVELTVRAVFDTPTPAGLAARLVEQFRAEFDIDLDAMDDDELSSDAEASGLESGRPELSASVRPDRLPLSYSPVGCVFLARMEGGAGRLHPAVRVALRRPAGHPRPGGGPKRRGGPPRGAAHEFR